ncbi:hypothetical protein DBB_48700 [Desulfoluna spongiiphila]|nr:hypothetical protein DBB_48700 [Desulfoluna spongiiphila]
MIYLRLLTALKIRMIFDEQYLFVKTIIYLPWLGY